MHLGARASSACTLCRKERWAGAVPTMSLAHNLLLTRATAAMGRAAAGSIRRAAASGGRDIIRSLQRQGRRGRMPAARRCRAAICRSSSSGARSTPDPRLLIVSQPTWGWTSARPPRSAARSWPARRRLRGAGGQRGTGRTVRDQRPAARDRQGPAVAPARTTRRGHHVPIGEWMRPWPGAGPCPCCKPGRMLKPARPALLELRLAACWRCWSPW